MSAAAVEARVAQSFRGSALDAVVGKLLDDAGPRLDAAYGIRYGRGLTVSQAGGVYVATWGGLDKVNGYVRVEDRSWSAALRRLLFAVSKLADEVEARAEAG